MATVIDYLEWRGDLSMDVIPMNNLDALAFARFAYLPLNIMDLKEEETVASILALSETLAPEEFKRKDRDLIRLMGEGPRFAAMKVTDYIRSNKPEEEKQFSAVTVHINENEMVITFCGTDSTVYGWKEDFNMSFMEEIPAQSDALKYAQTVMKKYPGKNVHLVGHSKGGNLAVFVFYLLDEETSRILDVKNFDGPGFHQELLDEYASADEISRITSFMPSESVFGRILEHAEPLHAVESDDHGLEQHDVYNWHVRRDDLVYLPELSDNSNVVKAVIDRVMYQNSPEDRKAYIDGIYNIITTSEGETTAEVKQNFGKSIPAIVRKLNGMAEDEWKLLTSITGEFASSFVEESLRNTGEKLSPNNPLRSFLVPPTEEEKKAYDEAVERAKNESLLEYLKTVWNGPSEADLEAAKKQAVHDSFPIRTSFGAEEETAEDAGKTDGWLASTVKNLFRSPDSET